MDFSKFISLLQRRELFFVRTGVLAQTADLYEGGLPAMNYEHPDIAADHYAQRLVNPEDQALVRRQYSEPQAIETMAKVASDHVYVNCWHRNDQESAAMWKLYLAANEGIAVRSTVGRFRQSFDCAPGAQYIMPVNYYDPRKSPIPIDPFQIPLWKRMSFSHEQEVRAMVLQPDVSSVYPSASESGIYVPCAIETLVEGIVVAPTTPDYVLEAVKEIVRLFSLDRAVERSALDAPPGAPVVV